MSIKLNLGCGNQVIEGYQNIDIMPANTLVKRGDFRNLTSLGITDGSVEEILAIHILEYVPFHQMGALLQQWINKLIVGGKLYIESIDLNIIGTMMSYDQIEVKVLNDILYAGAGQGLSTQGLYNLTSLESHLQSLNCKTDIKGFRDYNFYLRVEKK